MKATHTILCPQMSPIHFEMLEAAFRGSGYRFEILPNDNKQAVDVGLKYVNNDACYPSLIVVGQIMEALLSGNTILTKWQLSLLKQEEDAALPIISDLYGAP